MLLVLLNAVDVIRQSDRSLGFVMIAPSHILPSYTEKMLHRGAQAEHHYRYIHQPRSCHVSRFNRSPRLKSSVSYFKEDHACDLDYDSQFVVLSNCESAGIKQRNHISAKIVSGW